MTVVVQRQRTAMARTMLSRPMALAYEDSVISPAVTVFDFGCGRGGDIRQLQRLGVTASGWDPNHRPDEPQTSADVVNLGFVINVIENLRERRDVLRRAWSLARQTLVVAARPSWEGRDVRGIPHQDGILTTKDTFQKFYEQDELRGFVESTLGERAVAAAPGVFYVFRDQQLAQAVLARRARGTSSERVARVSDLLFELHREELTCLQEFVGRERRLPKPGELAPASEQILVEELGSMRAAFALIRRATGSRNWTDVDVGRPNLSERRFDENRPLLEPLIEFVEIRGRLPRPDELDAGVEIDALFGSIRSAFALVRRITGGERWSIVEERSRQNFLVYLALAAFGGRPRFSELPEDLQFDVRDLFGTYKRAVAEADRLLFDAGNAASIDAASRDATVGKLTSEALYVHVSALDELLPILRVYEGCGQALSGTVEDATLIKLHRQKAQVSYLSYPTFDQDPHPALATVVVSRLQKLNLTFRDFRDSDNPPILHRKELFVAPGYAGRDKFARLTRQEDSYDLLSSPSIGTRLGWQAQLLQRDVQLKGHRVVKRMRAQA